MDCDVLERELLKHKKELEKLRAAKERLGKALRRAELMLSGLQLEPQKKDSAEQEEDEEEGQTLKRDIERLKSELERASLEERDQTEVASLLEKLLSELKGEQKLEQKQELMPEECKEAKQPQTELEGEIAVAALPSAGALSPLWRPTTAKRSPSSLPVPFFLAFVGSRKKQRPHFGLSTRTS